MILESHKPIFLINKISLVFTNILIIVQYVSTNCNSFCVHAICTPV